RIDRIVGDTGTRALRGGGVDHWALVAVLEIAAAHAVEPRRGGDEAARRGALLACLVPVDAGCLDPLELSGVDVAREVCCLYCAREARVGRDLRVGPAPARLE